MSGVQQWADHRAGQHDKWTCAVRERVDLERPEHTPRQRPFAKPPDGGAARVIHLAGQLAGVVAQAGDQPRDDAEDIHEIVVVNLDDVVHVAAVFGDPVEPHDGLECQVPVGVSERSLDDVPECVSLLCDLTGQMWVWSCPQQKQQPVCEAGEDLPGAEGLPDGGPPGEV